MITIKTMKQIATSRVIPGCRSLSRLGSYRLVSSDRARRVAGAEQIKMNQARRRWVNQAYCDRLSNHDS
jgi:hypothetical protein